MSNEDARLHGHRGAEELTPQQELAVRISNLFCGEEAEVSYSAALDASVAWIDAFVARLASNPSPEPVDAEVRKAVHYFDNFRHPYNIADSEFWQTIKAALFRSQAGQGRDTARLDWLEGQKGYWWGWIIVEDSEGGVYIDRGGENPGRDAPPRHPKFRDAIDAAINRAQEPREP